MHFLWEDRIDCDKWTKNGCGGLKRFIRYLYEYEQGQRMRNVGFVKVEQDEKNTIVHIHGKGLKLTGDKTLKIYIFFTKEKECIGIYQGTAENANPAVNYRLTYTAEDTGKPENYPLIEGIVMENADHRHFAAVWTDMPVNVDEMQIWKPEPDIQQMVQETVSKQEEKNAAKSAEELEPAEPAEPAAAEDAGPEMINRPEPVEEMDIDLYGQQSEEESESDEGYITPSKVQYSKIQRQDIANLPRCEWRLANNSFLLHGYYNYHHLLFIEDGDECWLGVPGIYHPREAKAAEAFGFPRFIRIEEGAVDLGESEKNEKDDFGYWCRQVRR